MWDRRVALTSGCAIASDRLSAALQHDTASGQRRGKERIVTCNQCRERVRAKDVERTLSGECVK